MGPARVGSFSCLFSNFYFLVSDFYFTVRFVIKGARPPTLDATTSSSAAGLKRSKELPKRAYQTMGNECSKLHSS
jgi:hypothetical protein